MELSVEISLYPLRDEYIPTIETFIERLAAHDELTVLSSTMSTRVIGPYDRVFEVLHAELRRVHEANPHVVAVTKLVGGDLRPRDGSRYS